MFSYDGAATSALRPPKPANPFGFTGRHSEPVCPTPDYEISVFANAVYYPNWRIYKKQPPSSLRLGYVSHVFYAFAGYITPSLSGRSLFLPTPQYNCSLVVPLERTKVPGVVR
jgi:hypothetical protein